MVAGPSPSPASPGGGEQIRQALEDRGIDVGYMVTTATRQASRRQTSGLLRRVRHRVIVVYLEGGGTRKLPRRLQAAAPTASDHRTETRRVRGRPCAAMAHTGALAGSIETSTRFPPRRRDPRARLDELIEDHRMLRACEAAEGHRLAAVTLSGGKSG